MESIQALASDAVVKICALLSMFGESYLMVSANAFAEDIQNSVAAGMDAHIAKPIEFSKLKEQLKLMGKDDRF